VTAESPQQLQLQYARQPPSSLASCQYRGDGGVIIVIPPMVQRRFVKVALTLACAGVIVGPLIFVAAVVGPLQRLPLLTLLSSIITFPALAAVCVTLWMGFRWTIIEAGREGLRVELRGLLTTRRRFIERERIGRLKHLVSIWILDARGWPLGRVDATDQTEDAWVMEVLTRALAIPPPLPAASAPLPTPAPPLPPPPLQKTA
jgi:hypothetical protein